MSTENETSGAHAGVTTAIVTETGRGNLPVALALGCLLLSLAFAVNLLLTLVQQRRTV